MKITDNFKLISGLFTTADADAMIKSFYAEKIRHHNRQLLKIMETNKGDREAVEAKLTELHATSNKVSAFLKMHQNNGRLVGINGSIEVTIDSESALESIQRERTGSK